MCHDLQQLQLKRKCTQNKRVQGYIAVANNFEQHQKSVCFMKSNCQSLANNYKTCYDALKYQERGRKRKKKVFLTSEKWAHSAYSFNYPRELINEDEEKTTNIRKPKSTGKLIAGICFLGHLLLWLALSRTAISSFQPHPVRQLYRPDKTQGAVTLSGILPELAFQ